MRDKNKPMALDVGAAAPLEPDMQAYFAKCMEKLGLVPNVLRAYAFDIAKLGPSRMFDDLMLGDSGLSKLEREMIAVAVSLREPLLLLPDGPWRRGAPARQRPGDGRALAENYRAADLPPRQRAMLDFAVKLTEAPRQDRGARPQGAAPRRLQRPRHLGHRRGRRLLQHVEPHGGAIDMRPNREYHYMVREPTGSGSRKPNRGHRASPAAAPLGRSPAARRR